MAASKISGVFSGMWDALNFTRNLILNIIFVLFAVLVLALIFGSTDESRRPIAPKTTLVIDIQGALVEKYTQDGLSRILGKLTGNESTSETRLYDVLLALSHAKSDPRITQVYLRTDGMTVAGLAQIREIGKAITDLRTAKKKVVSFGENLDQKQYLLSAYAEDVFMDPNGSLLIEGLGRYRQYYREALQDKLGVDMHLFRVGEFKSAAEPYILDHASEESKMADLFWMNDVWSRYIDDVSDARGFSATEFRSSINNVVDLVEQSHGDLAALAVKQKWVDGLKTQEQVEEFLVSQGSYDSQEERLQSVSLNDYVSDVKASIPTKDKTIAVVVAQGEIVDGDGSPDSIGGASFAHELQEVREDSSVKAVVIRVDSPGGGVFASEQIRREIEMIKKSGRPVVVSMGNMAASGGYWISMDADAILADESTITGSIGIFGIIPNVSRALEKIGVHTDGVGTSTLAGAFDVTRPLDNNVSRVMQSVINHGYDQFISKVATARKMPLEKVDKNARGRVWSGQQAHERGLVDEMGGLGNAIRKAAALSQLHLEDVNVTLVEEDTSSLAGFLSGVGAHSSVAQWGRSLGAWDAASTLLISHAPKGDLSVLSQSMDPKKPVHVFAHCLCGL